MSKNQFIIQTIIQIATVLVTLLLAAIAIWGDWIKSKLLGPRLHLSLFDPKGERTTVDTTPVHYYHLKVTNKRRSAPAHNVKVILFNLVKTSTDGTISDVSISGHIQFTWQFMGAVGQFPTLGPPLNCDLGFLTKDKTFRLCLIFTPNYLTPELITLSANEKMQIEAIAFSDEIESNKLSLEITWDGIWPDNANEINNHLIIREINNGKKTR